MNYPYLNCESIDINIRSILPTPDRVPYPNNKSDRSPLARYANATKEININIIADRMSEL